MTGPDRGEDLATALARRSVRRAWIDLGAALACIALALVLLGVGIGYRASDPGHPAPISASSHQPQTTHVAPHAASAP